MSNSDFTAAGADNNTNKNDTNANANATNENNNNDDNDDAVSTLEQSIINDIVESLEQPVVNNNNLEKQAIVEQPTMMKRTMMKNMKKTKKKNLKTAITHLRGPQEWMALTASKMQEWHTTSR